MALRHADVDVRAITVVAGNVPLAQGLVNALYFTELCAADVPVYAGAGKPLLREYVSADWFHGADGLGDWGDRYKPRRTQASDMHAVDAIIECARSTPGLLIVTLGPLTNLALALRKAPDIIPLVSRCVVMGGAACTHGNVTPAAEYNIWCDPEAAKIVFRSGLPVEMVGWEFSRGDFALSLDDIELVRAIKTPYAEFAIDCNIKACAATRFKPERSASRCRMAWRWRWRLSRTICGRKASTSSDVACASERRAA